MIGLVAACSPTAEQQGDYNSLISTIHDLDNQTPLNATMLKYECSGFPAKAAAYRNIRAWRINTKVDRYVDGCKKLIAKDPTPPPTP